MSEDMFPFEVADETDSENILKDPAFDENIKKFVEQQEMANRLMMKRLKEGFKLASIQLDSYSRNVDNFYQAQPFFYDKSGIFWFWDINENKWSIVDDIDVVSSLDDRFKFEGQTVNKSLKNNYLEAFKRVGRKKQPKKAHNKWIQFKDKAYSITANTLYTVTPDYFFTNPIPWEIGVSDKTPVMDKLFEEWVGKDNVQMLYEIVAYCCYTNYPIQLIFCLCGSGRNGKSCFIRLLTRFLGHSNVCSTELDTLLSSRFETFKLYKKLLCCMGETNFGVLSRTSMLKKLVGGDVIGFEKKNKDPFDEFNYAKIMIASNSLPSSNDTSEGFYRRWLIIDFPNEFPEGKDILKTIPEEEYNNLANKVTKILPTLLESGKFINQGKIEQRKQKYIMASNPLPIFLNMCCFREEGIFVLYSELYTAYVHFLKKNKKRKVLMKEFKSSLEDEGFWVERTSKKINEDDFKSGRWIDGLELKADWKQQIYDNYANLHLFLHSEQYKGGDIGLQSQKALLTQKPQETVETEDLEE